MEGRRGVRKRKCLLIKLSVLSLHQEVVKIPVQSWIARNIEDLQAELSIKRSRIRPIKRKSKLCVAASTKN